mgnify:CR=1 FL=1
MGLLFDAWYGWSFISNDTGMRPAILNESEASSFLFLGLFAISGLFLIWRFGIRRNNEHRGVILGVLAVVFMLLVHVFIGWGPLITKVTLLDRVPPGRAILGLGIASTILLVLIGKIVADAAIPPRWRRLATASTVAVGGAGILWLGAQWRRDGLPIDRSTIANSPVRIFGAFCSAFLEAVPRSCCTRSYRYRCFRACKSINSWTRTIGLFRPRPRGKDAQ